MAGLCIRLGWLPSAALDEDWAMLAEIQERLLEQQENQEIANWAQQVRQTFG